MILNVPAIVLSRRKVGEYDRLAVLLTETHGKLTARFGGVDRPAGKLKALSEPMACGEYRLYFSPKTQQVRVVGGHLRATWPALRRDLPRTMAALCCCEMAAQLLADRQAAAAAYRLLDEALQAIESGGHPWIETAFGLKLLELTGFSLRELPVPPGEGALWSALHDLEFSELAALPQPEAAGRRLRQIVLEHVEAHSERPLKTRLFAESLVPAADAAGARPFMVLREGLA